MRYRTLGRTGLEVSVLGFGGAPLGIGGYLGPYDPSSAEGEASAALNRALDLGVNFIDTAPYYRLSEEIIGRAVSGRRGEFRLATKVAPALSPEETVSSVEESLRRLGTDHVDVIQPHGGGDGDRRHAHRGGGREEYSNRRKPRLHRCQRALQSPAYECAADRVTVLPETLRGL